MFVLAGCILVAGCGPSEFQQMIQHTRADFKAADVKAAALPLFSREDVESLSGTNLPKEIIALPLFAEYPQGVTCRRMTTNTLMFVTGGGFGHWGLIIHHTAADPEATKDLHAKVIPWSDGVLFWDEL